MSSRTLQSCWLLNSGTDSRTSHGEPTDQRARTIVAPSSNAAAQRRIRQTTGRGFIGDYFGLAISNGKLYTYAVSTHYPSPTVTADGGGPVYYQQQVLGIVPRSTFGAGTRRPGLARRVASPHLGGALSGRRP